MIGIHSISGNFIDKTVPSQKRRQKKKKKFSWVPYSYSIEKGTEEKKAAIKRLLEHTI